jgi:hypothetical protein
VRKAGERWEVSDFDSPPTRPSTPAPFFATAPAPAAAARAARGLTTLRRARQANITVPLSEGVLRYNYVVLSSKQPRTEARVAERAVALKGLAPGSVLHVHDSFRSPKIASIASSCFSRAIFGRGHQARRAPL